MRLFSKFNKIHSFYSKKCDKIKYLIIKYFKFLNIINITFSIYIVNNFLNLFICRVHRISSSTHHFLCNLSSCTNEINRFLDMNLFKKIK